MPGRIIKQTFRTKRHFFINHMHAFADQSASTLVRLSFTPISVSQHGRKMALIKNAVNEHG